MHEAVQPRACQAGLTRWRAQATGHRCSAGGRGPQATGAALAGAGHRPQATGFHGTGHAPWVGAHFPSSSMPVAAGFSCGGVAVVRGCARFEENVPSEQELRKSTLGRAVASEQAGALPWHGASWRVCTVADMYQTSLCAVSLAGVCGFQATMQSLNSRRLLQDRSAAEAQAAADRKAERQKLIEEADKREEETKRLKEKKDAKGPGSDATGADYEDYADNVSVVTSNGWKVPDFYRDDLCIDGKCELTKVRVHAILTRVLA
eukprot:364282-Chlamydomonas_euryale.AAC.18